MVPVDMAGILPDFWPLGFQHFALSLACVMSKSFVRL
jgi:hypothetical protein